jgi:ketosteroid isomerase-like protein
MHALKPHRLATAGWVILTGTLMLTQPAVAPAQTGRQTAPGVSPADRVAVLEAGLNIGLAYRQWIQAFNKKDADALVQWVEHNDMADFIFKERDGRTETRQGLEAHLKKDIPSTKAADDASMRIDKLMVTGNTAIAMVSYSFSDLRTDPKGETGKRMKQCTQRDTWVKTTNGWKVKSSEELPDSTRKVLTPPARKRQRGSGGGPDLDDPRGGISPRIRRGGA